MVSNNVISRITRNELEGCGEKAKGRTKEEEKDMMVQFMQVFTEFGAIKDQTPDGAEAQSQVKKLQDYITEHFYQCSDEILSGLGQREVHDAVLAAEGHRRFCRLLCQRV